jgi:hypothetical protein
MAVFAAVIAAWHFTGGMHGTIVQVHTPARVSAATTTSFLTTQCEALPSTAASPSASATPTPSSAAAQLCVGVEAAQLSVKRGDTATWTIQLQAENGPASAVTVVLSTAPSGVPAVFTGSCPSGGGSTSCTVGDMNTATTPASYQLQAQTTVPAGTSGGNLTLTASADTSPAMAAAPAAGQDISITGTTPTPAAKPSPKPSAARTSATASASAQPAVTPAAQPTTQQPGTLPVGSITTEPSIGGLPTAAPVTTTVAPGSISGALPQVTPVVATVPAVTSSPAANIQDAGVAPTPSATPGGDSFAISIRMSAQTAQVLGWILLALVVTLIASKLVSDHFARNRHPRPAQPKPSEPGKRRTRRLPRPRFARLRIPRPRLRRPKLRARPSRAERRATREQNWKRYLESQKQPAADETAVLEAPESVNQNP